ncbi:hypothetical protein F1559_001336 [Cyanidiococcus yangmingshanensis]|uniref:RNA polymerase sigma factor 70 region 1.1 domain-containing protein n=1 Tax=Cyanidiococcus yangmingshanensis TaxID=2690220 RepID=A0A7J7IG70_9RHOD|nr:hypothetical protein F1559_001336 [Cyanidiococcus yangmingshanensis]
MFGFYFVLLSSRWRSGVSASSCTPVELRRTSCPRVATFGCRSRLVARAKKEPDRRQNESFPVSSSTPKAQAPDVEGHAPDLKEFLPPTMREFVDYAGADWQRELELAERNRDAKSVAKPKKRPEEDRMYDISVYSIAELAEDYRLPPEWLIEVLVDIGIELPIRLSDTLADLNASEEEIQELLDRLYGVCREGRPRLLHRRDLRGTRRRIRG